MAQIRPYRGVEASERLTQRRRRLLDAGLDLLGADSSESELTVRAVCKRSGLTARYFYESFTDKDEFVAAVFDAAGMANLVRIVSTDSRVGRLLFDVHMSNPVILRKRSDLGGNIRVSPGSTPCDSTSPRPDRQEQRRRPLRRRGRKSNHQRLAGRRGQPE